MLPEIRTYHHIGYSWSRSVWLGVRLVVRSKWFFIWHVTILRKKIVSLNLEDVHEHLPTLFSSETQCPTAR